MRFAFAQLPDWRTRPADHRSHLFDVDDPAGEYLLLCTARNAYVASRSPDCVHIYPPLPPAREEDLAALIRPLQHAFGQVHLWLFPVATMLRSSVLWKSLCDSNHIYYQQPLATETYDRKLSRFRKSGYAFRQLGNDDVPAVEELIGAWEQEKWRIAVRRVLDRSSSTGRRFERAVRDGVEMALSRMQAKRRDGEPLRASLSEHLLWWRTVWHVTRTGNADAFRAALSEAYQETRRIAARVDYSRELRKPHVRLFGAFRDDELLAYTEVSGNARFHKWNRRASLRVNTYSPQEFCDLSVARRLAAEGVSVFERGYRAPWPGAESLLAYKKRFGPLHEVYEASFLFVQADSSRADAPSPGTLPATQTA